ncbi:MAG: prepilin-type N-terminal cleavage/methylation domain-containing protein [Phycisphaerales bacterium]|nr:prepilin-type N-terminal cleavage/methylation domain-containing protein [Phycisphaerales bacterium]
MSGRRAPFTSEFRASGFSLAEVVMVTAIVAILGALLSPRYAGTVTRFKAEGAARRVAADLALAQRHARMNGAPRTVAFDLSTHSYTLEGIPDPVRVGVDYGINLADETYNARITSLDLVTNNNDSIVFDGYGVPNTGGKIVVSVGVESRTINIDADTGQAEVP